MEATRLFSVVFLPFMLLNRKDNFLVNHSLQENESFVYFFCRCRLGWQGPKCKQCAVLPGCVHGTCQGPLECRCEPGWTGLLCQTRKLSVVSSPRIFSKKAYISLLKLSFYFMYLERFLSV